MTHAKGTSGSSSPSYKKQETESLRSISSTASSLASCQSMMPHCLANGCRNHSGRSTSLTFHAFPRDASLAESWARCCSVSAGEAQGFVQEVLGAQPGKHYLCSKHFEESMFEPREESWPLPAAGCQPELPRHKLKPEAEPSLFGSVRPQVHALENLQMLTSDIKMPTTDSLWGRREPGKEVKSCPPTSPCPSCCADLPRPQPSVNQPAGELLEPQRMLCTEMRPCPPPPCCVQQSPCPAPQPSVTQTVLGFLEHHNFPAKETLCGPSTSGCGSESSCRSLHPSLSQYIENLLEQHKEPKAEAVGSLCVPQCSSHAACSASQPLVNQIVLNFLEQGKTSSQETSASPCVSRCTSQTEAHSPQPVVKQIVLIFLGQQHEKTAQCTSQTVGFSCPSPGDQLTESLLGQHHKLQDAAAGSPCEAGCPSHAGGHSPQRSVRQFVLSLMNDQKKLGRETVLIPSASRCTSRSPPVHPRTLPVEEKEPVTFDDIAVYFSREEWDILEVWQKEVYQDVMRENYDTLVSLGFPVPSPDVFLSLMERHETPCAESLRPWEERDMLSRSSCASTSSSSSGSGFGGIAWELPARELGKAGCCSVEQTDEKFAVDHGMLPSSAHISALVKLVKEIPEFLLGSSPMTSSPSSPRSLDNTARSSKPGPDVKLEGTPESGQAASWEDSVKDVAVHAPGPSHTPGGTAQGEVEPWSLQAKRPHKEVKAEEGGAVVSAHIPDSGTCLKESPVNSPSSTPSSLSHRDWEWRSRRRPEARRKRSHKVKTEEEGTVVSPHIPSSETCLKESPVNSPPSTPSSLSRRDWEWRRRPEAGSKRSHEAEDPTGSGFHPSSLKGASASTASLSNASLGILAHRDNELGRCEVAVKRMCAEEASSGSAHLQGPVSGLKDRALRKLSPPYITSGWAANIAQEDQEQRKPEMGIQRFYAEKAAVGSAYFRGTESHLQELTGNKASLSSNVVAPGGVVQRRPEVSVKMEEILASRRLMMELKEAPVLSPDSSRLTVGAPGGLEWRRPDARTKRLCTQEEAPGKSHLPDLVNCLQKIPVNIPGSANLAASSPAACSAQEGRERRRPEMGVKKSYVEAGMTARNAHLHGLESCVKEIPVSRPGPSSMGAAPSAALGHKRPEPGPRLSSAEAEAAPGASHQPGLVSCVPRVPSSASATFSPEHVVELRKPELSVKRSCPEGSHGDINSLCRCANCWKEISVSKSSPSCTTSNSWTGTSSHRERRAETGVKKCYAEADINPGNIHLPGLVNCLKKIPVSTSRPSNLSCGISATITSQGHRELRQPELEIKRLHPEGGSIGSSALLISENCSQRTTGRTPSPSSPAARGLATHMTQGPWRPETGVKRSYAEAEISVGSVAPSDKMNCMNRILVNTPSPSSVGSSNSPTIISPRDQEPKRPEMCRKRMYSEEGTVGSTQQHGPVTCARLVPGNNPSPFNSPISKSPVHSADGDAEPRRPEAGCKKAGAEEAATGNTPLHDLVNYLKKIIVSKSSSSNTSASITRGDMGSRRPETGMKRSHTEGLERTAKAKESRMQDMDQLYKKEIPQEGNKLREKGEQQEGGRAQDANNLQETWQLEGKENRHGKGPLDNEARPQEMGQLQSRANPEVTEQRQNKESLQKRGQLLDEENLQEAEKLQEKGSLPKASKVHDQEKLQQMGQQQETEKPRDQENLQEAEKLQEKGSLPEASKVHDQEKLQQMGQQQEAEKPRDQENLQEAEKLQEKGSLPEASKVQDQEKLQQMGQQQEAEKPRDQENLQEAEKLENKTNLKKMQPMQEVDKPQDKENLREAEKPQDKDKRQGMGQLYKVDTLQEKETMQKAEKLQDKENVQETNKLPNQEKTQETGQLPGAEKQQDKEKRQKTENLEDKENLQGVGQPQDKRILQEAEKPQEREPLQEAVRPQNVQEAGQPQEKEPLQEAVRPQNVQEAGQAQEKEPLQEAVRPQNVQEAGQPQEKEPLQEAVRPQNMQETGQPQEKEPLQEAVRPQNVQEAGQAQEKEPLQEAVRPQNVQEAGQAQEKEPLQEAVRPQNVQEAGQPQEKEPLQEAVRPQNVQEAGQPQEKEPLQEAVRQQENKHLQEAEKPQGASSLQEKEKAQSVRKLQKIEMRQWEVKKVQEREAKALREQEARMLQEPNTRKLQERETLLSWQRLPSWLDTPASRCMEESDHSGELNGNVHIKGLMKLMQEVLVSEADQCKETMQEISTGAGEMQGVERRVVRPPQIFYSNDDDACPPDLTDCIIGSGDSVLSDDISWSLENVNSSYSALSGMKKVVSDFAETGSISPFIVVNTSTSDRVQETGGKRKFHRADAGFYQASPRHSVSTPTELHHRQKTQTILCVPPGLDEPSFVQEQSESPGRSRYLYLSEKMNCSPDNVASSYSALSGMQKVVNAFAENGSVRLLSAVSAPGSNDALDTSVKNKGNRVKTDLCHASPRRLTGGTSDLQQRQQTQTVQCVPSKTAFLPEQSSSSSTMRLQELFLSKKLNWLENADSSYSALGGMQKVVSDFAEAGSVSPFTVVNTPTSDHVQETSAKNKSDRVEVGLSQASPRHSASSANQPRHHQHIQNALYTPPGIVDSSYSALSRMQKVVSDFAEAGSISPFIVVNTPTNDHVQEISAKDKSDRAEADVGPASRHMARGPSHPRQRQQTAAVQDFPAGPGLGRRTCPGQEHEPSTQCIDLTEEDDVPCATGNPSALTSKKRSPSADNREVDPSHDCEPNDRCIDLTEEEDLPSKTGNAKPLTPAATNKKRTSSRVGHIHPAVVSTHYIDLTEEEVESDSDRTRPLDPGPMDQEGHASEHGISPVNKHLSGLEKLLQEMPALVFEGPTSATSRFDRRETLWCKSSSTHETWENKREMSKKGNHIPSQ
ncbi:uncharacterized protein LOC115083911 isoform X4 [Rhinatrema bivittatum]|uniref:uncharacterized protein LOC115083911 isoform X4 n=1 Tax=Rhinatrema bivittatum TaxID=194408 RepID=UPI0011261C67|nr:uncharacterized protein LOC115083911 isoform X4 [Rhinatrema bivittatum]